MHPAENAPVPESRFAMFANDETRRPAFVRYFGLRENPFRTTSDPRYLLLTNQTRQALDGLLCGIDARVGLLVLTGEVGAGKTVLLNSLLEALRHRGTPRAFIFNSHLDIDDLFEMVLADFGAPPDAATHTKPLVRLQRLLLDCYRTNSNAVLIIDEAQGLKLEVLEAIRMLLNMEPGGEKLVQIVLAGQPEFDTKINLPELRQLRQRVAVRYRLGALSLEETCLYIEHRLCVAGSTGECPFEAESLAAIHYYARGTPRVINALCEQALMKACAERMRPVAPKTVEEIAFQFQVDGNKPVGAPLQLGDLMLMNAVAARSKRANAMRTDSGLAGNAGRVEPRMESKTAEPPVKTSNAVPEPIPLSVVAAELIESTLPGAPAIENLPEKTQPATETPIALVPTPVAPVAESPSDEGSIDPIQLIVSAAAPGDIASPAPARPTAADARIPEAPATALEMAPAADEGPAQGNAANEPLAAPLLVMTAAAGAAHSGPTPARPVTVKAPVVAATTPSLTARSTPPRPAAPPSIHKAARLALRSSRTSAGLAKTHLSLLASLSSIERAASNWLRWLRQPIGSGRGTMRGKAR
ncbi:MAG TPA: AAA family ATPase [Candidatus Acidoferrales bacterium]|jgi:general secretion pathway protein A|nr:AAA family ATPase [Candidatus Acidoferrales bacterium]